MNELPLRDIHLPDAISWWPLAYGWWICFACLLFALWCLKKRKEPTIKKEAAKALEAIEAAFYEKNDAIFCLAEVSVLLRRVVISHEKYSACSASLIGDAWLKILDEPLKTPEFSQGAGRILLAGPYQSSADAQSVIELLQLCKKWVKSL